MNPRRTIRAAALAVACSGAAALPAGAYADSPIANVNPPGADALTSFVARATQKHVHAGTRVTVNTWTASGTRLSGVRVNVVRTHKGERKTFRCGVTDRKGRTSCTVARPSGSRLAVYARSGRTQIRVRFAG